MAEGLFNTLAPEGWEAGSAGTDPHGSVRAEAIAVMREIGIDISRHRPKSIADAASDDIELAVGLCEEEACPVIPGIRTVHWPLPNPAGRELPFFRDIRDDLAARIRQLIRDLTGAQT
jgi:arsenate reductase